MKAISWQASMLAGFRFRADARHACGSRAKAAIGEMHRILDAIRKRDADAAYRASADHVRKVAELARNALTAGVDASKPDQRASSRNQ